MHTNFEVEEYKGNDWFGQLIAILLGFVIAFIILGSLTAIVDMATGYQLHEVFGEVISK